MKMFRAKYPVAAVLLCALGAPLMIAQDNGANGPPKVLVINREYTKPGKDGPPHQAVEAACPRSLAIEALPNSTRKRRLSYSVEFETEVSRELAA